MTHRDLTCRSAILVTFWVGCGVIGLSAAQQPAFSHPSGLYRESFSLELSVEMHSATSW